MAGYSGTPLVRKLGIKDDHVVFLDDAPDDLDLDDRRSHRRTPAAAHRVDVTLTFHTSYAELAGDCPSSSTGPTTAGMVWVCWPKKSAQKQLGIASDLDENRIRDLGLELGFVDVKVAAIDETWSGAQVRPPARGPLAGSVLVRLASPR